MESDWKITISGSGPHHNFDHKNSGGYNKIYARANDVDADLMFKEFVEKLSKNHRVENSHFEVKLVEEASNIIGHDYLNPDLEYSNTKILISNFQRMKSMMDNEPLFNFILLITETILKQYEEKLFPHDYIMFGPVTNFEAKTPDEEDQLVEAHAYNLNIPAFKIPFYGSGSRLDIDEKLTNTLLEALSKELIEIVDKLEEENIVMCPYILLYPIINTDQVTSEYHVAFKTRYGKRKVK